MKKTIFAFVALAVMALMASCGNEEQSEITVTVSDVTDTTAVVSCDFTPVKSVSYRLQVDESVSEEFDKSMEFDLTNLVPGTRYEVVATTYDADHKQVSTDVVNFMTSGEPDNQIVNDHRPGIISRDSTITIE